MNTTTAIVPLQKNTAGIVPKPTQAQMIDVMVAQVIAQREIENLRRKTEREKIQIKLDKAIEKFKKGSIKLADLRINWNNAGAFCYCPGLSIDGSPEMKRLAAERAKYNSLDVNPPSVREEVKDKIQKEMMTSIMEQPGIREALKSTINKLGL